MPRIVGERYAIPDEPVQVGGHSSLFRGTDLKRNNQAVALKIFNPPNVADDRVLLASWTNELRAYQSLGEHANLVVLIDFGRTEDDRPFLVFEWLEGDLFTIPVELDGWDDLWPLAREILSGLAALHSQGYVHRDLKPENVLRGSDGGIKVADFGTVRLSEFVNLGLTMAALGTEPYSPPERGTASPTASYDVYSFAVVCIVLLRGRTFGTAETLAEFNELDLPDDVGRVLKSCLNTDPVKRPASASAVFSSLTQIQVARDQRRAPSTELFLAISNGVCLHVERLFGLPAGKGADHLEQDLSGMPAFSFTGGTAASAPELRIVGQSLLCTLVRERESTGVWRVVKVTRPSGAQLDGYRQTWLERKVKVRWTLPTDPLGVAKAADELTEFVNANDVTILQTSANSNSLMFPSWRNVLKAKFEIEDNRGERYSYSKVTASGARMSFSLTHSPSISVGESRLIKVGRRTVLRGEVEGFENGDLIVYVTAGRLSDIPKVGSLEFDADASKSKLRREQAALDRISEGKSVRSDLRDLLSDPGTSSAPKMSGSYEFVTKGLDEAKRHAVTAALGADDFLLVQGPPGTGKTTFIAELVAQELARNADCRILLASQTHIALDNALARVRDLCPDARLLRLGRDENLTADVEDLGLESRLSELQSNVSGLGNAFLKEYAARLGIFLGASEVEELALELKVTSDRAVGVRAQLAAKQTEHSVLSTELDRFGKLAQVVLDAAAELDSACKGSSESDLRAASDVFVRVGLQAAESIAREGEFGLQLEHVLRSVVLLERAHEAEMQRASAIATNLAEKLNLPADSSVPELIRLGTTGEGLQDQRLTKLQEIISDWSLRFGRSSEFNAVVVAGSDVVAATCVGIVGVPGVDNAAFDLCIMDEASKATATESIVPLSISRKWVLVGDDKQLPPFVESLLDSPSNLRSFDLTTVAVRETLFSVLEERLPKSCQVALTHQHRMQPGIGSLISKCFYGGALTSEPRELLAEVQTAMGSAVLWLDTSARGDCDESRDGKSFRNRGEARVVAQLLDRIDWVATHNGKALSVAVLTGYDAQRRELTEVLAAGDSARGSLSVRVANVDAYQGQEADIAIFSVTRSNAAGELGFLKNDSRINVALSRAREGLVIVGNSRFIDGAASGDNPLSVVLSYIRRNPSDCSIENAAVKG